MNDNTRNTFASMVLEILKVKRIKTLACLAFITIYLTIPAYSQTNFLQLPINGKAVGIGYQRFYPRDYIFINMSNEGQIIKGSVHYALIDSLTFSVSGGLQFYDPLRTRYYDQHTAFFFQGTALYETSPAGTGFGFFTKGAITVLIGEQERYFSWNRTTSVTLTEYYMPRVGVGIFYKGFPDVRPFIGFFAQHNLSYSSSKEWERESYRAKTFALMEGGVGIDVGEMLNLTGSVEMPFDLNVVLIQMACHLKF